MISRYYRHAPRWQVTVRVKTVGIATCYGLDGPGIVSRWGVRFSSSVQNGPGAFCPHSVFMCFVWISEQTAIISLYIINWLVFVTEMECVYCAVQTKHLTSTNSTFCPHSVFMCFVWISEPTAIIFLYSINWLVFITEMERFFFSCSSRCVVIT